MFLSAAEAIRTDLQSWGNDSPDSHAIYSGSLQVIVLIHHNPDVFDVTPPPRKNAELLLVQKMAGSDDQNGKHHMKKLNAAKMRIFRVERYTSP